MTIDLDYVAMKELLDDWSETVATVLRRKGGPKIQVSAPDLAAYLEGVEFCTPSSPQSVAQKEKELGISLPRDYLAFLSITNGWPIVDYCQSTLVGIERVGWYSVLYPESYRIWREPCGDSHGNFQRGIYGSAQSPELYAPEDLDGSIAISDNNESECILLNPSVTNGHYWETWLISPKLPGAMRFVSFYDFMHYAFSKVEESLNI